MKRFHVHVAVCYAKSDKHWVTDPAGIAWKMFRSLGVVPIYGENREAATEVACCAAAVEAALASRECCA